jgi:hypothetical protein
MTDVVRRALEDFINAYDKGAVQIASPDIDPGPDNLNDPHPPYPWHEEWLLNARGALSILAAMSDAGNGLTEEERSLIFGLQAEIDQVSGKEWKVEVLGDDARKIGTSYVYSPHLGGVAMVPPGSPARSAHLFYTKLIARLRNDTPKLLAIIARLAGTTAQPQKPIDEVVRAAWAEIRKNADRHLRALDPSHPERLTMDCHIAALDKALSTFPKAVEVVGEEELATIIRDASNEWCTNYGDKKSPTLAQHLSLAILSHLSLRPGAKEDTATLRTLVQEVIGAGNGDIRRDPSPTDILAETGWYQRAKTALGEGFLPSTPSDQQNGTAPAGKTA